MMKRSSVLILRRGISQLCKNGASTLTITSSVVTVTKTYEPRSLLPESLFRVHPLVTQALADNKPVVALESTIITHGMPYPHNLRYFLCNVHRKENICNFATAVFFFCFFYYLFHDNVIQHCKGGGGHCESGRSHSGHGGSDRWRGPSRPFFTGAGPAGTLRGLPQGFPTGSSLRR